MDDKSLWIVNPRDDLYGRYPAPKKYWMGDNDREEPVVIWIVHTSYRQVQEVSSLVRNVVRNRVLSEALYFSHQETYNCYGMVGRLLS